MPFQANVYRVLIASPSDVLEERNLIPFLIHEWNTQFAVFYKTVFLPVKWETHTIPDMGGRPQELINNQIVSDSDILIGVFWSKLGTDTGVAISGTVEEIEEFLKDSKKVMLYFSNKDIPRNAIDFEQLKKVDDFKAKCQSQGLYHNYDDLEQFKLLLSKHLTMYAQQNVSTHQQALTKDINKLTISIFNPENTEFQSNVKVHKFPNFNESKFIIDLKQKLFSLIEQIHEIPLPSYTVNESPNESFELAKLTKSAFGTTSVALSGIQRLHIIQKAKQLLNLDLEKDFFNVGNLVKPSIRPVLPFGSTTDSLTGTDSEIQKHEFINSFICKLNELDSYTQLFNSLGKFFSLPLVLRNIGNTFNESIKVKLILPKETQLLSKSNFVQPEFNIMKQFTKNIASLILEPIAKSNILKYKYTYLPTYTSPIPKNLLNQSTEEIQNELLSKFKRELSRIYCFDTYIENESLILVFEFDELKADENIWFPCHLLFQSPSSFIINYEITSKNLSNKVIGTIECSI
ncbi:hypothetical protein [Bacillus thuringiensis]|uniref:hypothetical protein n=1 Tax=Bacillus thuringiensis TaxID=1428 RepID=UPI000D56CE8A|nr:hypothetical protein [Bacillus thuringiensis]MBD8075467.1 hypothetical protein [Bacillus thuringiensis]